MDFAQFHSVRWWLDRLASNIVYGGAVGTTTSAGTTTTAVDSRFVRFPDNSLVGKTITFTEGTLSTTEYVITQNVGSTVTFTPTATAAPGTGAAYIITNEPLTFLRRLIFDAVGDIGPYLYLPYTNEADQLEDNEFEYPIPGYRRRTGTGDVGGSVTTLVEADFTQANDYWNGNILAYNPTDLTGEERVVSDFVAATDTMTFQEAFTQSMASVAWIAYEVIPAAVSKLQYLVDSSTDYWVDIPHDSWTIAQRGGIPTLQLHRENIGRRNRVWHIPDARPIRIIGTRHPITYALPAADGDMVEIPTGLMNAYLRYHYHLDAAVAPSMDAAAHGQRIVAARDDYYRLLDRAKAEFAPTPNSRKVA